LIKSNLKAKIMKKLIFSLFATLMVVFLMNFTIAFNSNSGEAIKLSSEIQIASADGQCWMYFEVGKCYCDQVYQMACIGLCGGNAPGCDMIVVEEPDPQP
jgi:hypothetical protein